MSIPHNSMEMDRLCTNLDVTAVFLFRNIILAGIGGSVYVFCAQNKSLLTTRGILSRYKIRGFSCSSGEKVLGFGGKEVGVFKVVKKAKEVEVIECTLLKPDDWVIYSKWVDSDGNIATLSAHNVITLWNVNERSKVWQVACQEQNILYSGFILGNNSNDLICFGGTVFGEVAIWSVHGKDFQNNLTKRPVLHHLIGHKGAVFSVNYNAECYYICTTSDDRSVRWWKVSWPSVELEQEKQSLFQLWSVANICLLSTAFGHLSRVWKCLSSGSLTFTVGEDSQICVWKSFKVKNAESQVEAVEFPLLARKQILYGGSIWSLDFSSDNGVVIGLEDGGIILWSLSSLLCQSTISCVKPLGKKDPLRRVCLYGKDLQPLVITKSGAILVSTGEDLSIPNWHNILEDYRSTGLGLLETSHSRKSTVVTSSDGTVAILSGASSVLKNEDIKFVAKVFLQEGYALSIHWLAEDLLLTCGSEGKLQLWLLRQKEGENGVLEEIGDWILPNSKQRWTTSAVWIPWGAPPGIILCGNRSGDLLLYNGGCKDPLQVLRSAHGHMGITSFLLLHRKNNVKEVKVKNWVPSYYEMYIDYQHPHNHEIESDLIIYSTGRNGILNSYVIRNGWLKIKGNERLGFEWAARCFVLNERIFVFGFKGGYAVIWGVQERSMWLEKDCGGGHRSWDLEFTFLNQEIMQLQLALIKNGELSLINWRIPSNGLFKSVLREGLHSKEINCIKWLTLTPLDYVNKPTIDSLVLMSGSEDTIAKISIFSPSAKGKSFEISTINSFSGHLSSIRTLFVLPLPQIDRIYDKGNKVIPSQPISTEENEGKDGTFHSMNFMVFTAGGRAQMKAWKLSFDLEDQRQLGNRWNFSQCRVEEQSSMLLGTKKYGQKEVLTDPEARFMEVCAFIPSLVTEKEPLMIAVAAACSDGILRIFGFHGNQNKSNNVRKSSILGLWSQGVPHLPPSKRHCLFRVSHRLLCGHHLLITADSVGYFHLWDITSHVNSMIMSLENADSASDCFKKRLVEKETLSPFFIKHVHQFSVNALDWLVLSRDSSDPNESVRLSSLLLVATGGEDGTLAINLLRLMRKNESEQWNNAEVQISWKEEFVMPTQISGLKFVGNKYLVTASKGQQVALWSWKCNIEDLSISASIVYEHFSEVPDIQDVEVIETIEGNYVSIGGCGLEVIHLSIPEEKE